MLVAFFESVKYAGHLYPVALLRVYMGYFYLNQALIQYRGQFLKEPIIAEQALQWLPRGLAPTWYSTFVEATIHGSWQIYASFFWGAELVIGLSFVLGYFVRPLSLVGVLLSLNYMWLYGPDQVLFFKTLIAVHVTLGWLGAGRCLGIDYFFFKRRRGVWW